jgi:predicted aconitase with swiveling domain
MVPLALSGEHPRGSDRRKGAGHVSCVGAAVLWEIAERGSAPETGIGGSVNSEAGRGAEARWDMGCTRSTL